MAKLVRKRPSALRDLAEIGAYLGQDSLDAEIRFYEAAEESFARILQMPNLGHVIHSLEAPNTDIRVQRVRGFPNWLVFYRVADYGVDVIRVLHGARDVGALLADTLADDQPEEERQNG